MSPIPDAPADTGDAEKVLIDLLLAELPGDWSVDVVPSFDQKTYTPPVVTVQQLNTTPQSQSFNGELYQEAFLVDVKVYGSTLNMKSQLREKVKQTLLDNSTNLSQDFCFLQLSPTRDLDSIDQAGSIYADNISVTLYRYLVKGGS